VVNGYGELACLAVCILLTSSAWSVWRDGSVTRHDLSRLVDSEDQLLHVEGVVVTDPVVRFSTGGLFARYSYRGARTYFQFRIEQSVGSDGTRQDLDGLVLVRVEGNDDRWQIGDRLDVYGILRAFPPPANPGEFDRVALARQQGMAGLLVTKNRGNLRRVGESTDWRFHIARYRASLQRQALDWLIPRDNATQDNSRREPLLAALVLGQRGPSLDDLNQAFQRVGLAHLLSISGLHLAILAGTVLLLARMTNVSPQVERLIVILFVIAYLFLVPARIPVWRAGIMVLVTTSAGLTGRRFHHTTILAYAAGGLLIWRPTELYQPGFQLSFGIVLGLMMFTGRFRDRLFGPIQHEPETEVWSLSRFTVEYGRTALIVALTAWLVSFPLVAFHFGSVSPFAAPLSIVAIPIVTVILAAGFITTLTAVIFPSVGLILSPVLYWSCEGLIRLVEVLDGWSCSNVAVGYPSLIWTLLMAGAIVWWMAVKHQNKRVCWLRWGCVAALVFWLFMPRLGIQFQSDQAKSRLIMFAVGNGSCYVVQSGHEAIMFDAGSGSYSGIGSAVIVPALRRLDIFKVQTVIISHADMDHFSASVDVMRAMGTQRLLLTPLMIQQAEEYPDGAPALLMAEARRMGIEIESVSQGDTRSIGEAKLNWLHPGWDDPYTKDNDRSMVTRVDLNDRRFLFTGDLQEEAALRLMMLPGDMLQADIMELPHHGGWSEQAESLVEMIDPEIVLQSTAPFRLKSDHWEDALKDRQRYITAKHGCTIISINRDGAFEVSTTLEPKQ